MGKSISYYSQSPLLHKFPELEDGTGIGWYVSWETPNFVLLHEYQSDILRELVGTFKQLRAADLLNFEKTKDSSDMKAFGIALKHLYSKSGFLLKSNIVQAYLSGYID